MEKILEINNLTKHFGLLKAVDNLSFTIEKGHVYGILGPNGSGKSTTLGMVLNVVNKTSGDFKWFGGISTHDALKKVGAIIERPNFYPYMTAYQNLKLVCQIKNAPLSRIDEKLELVGLLDRKHDKFSSYSLGMKQRLAIASALVNNPEVLILDEPTNGLDPQGIHQIRDIIKTIAQMGTSILLASHLLDEVEKVCSHVLIIRNGVKIYSGSVDNMSNNLGYFELASQDMELLEAKLRSLPYFSKLKKEENYLLGYLKENLSPTSLNRLLFEEDIVLSHMAFRKESLETKFLELTESNTNK